MSCEGIKTPLTEEQKALLTPRILQLVEAIPKKMARDEEEFGLMQSEAGMALVRAARTYDPKFGCTMQTHAYNNVLYSMPRVRTNRHKKRWDHLLSLDSPLKEGGKDTGASLLADERGDASNLVEIKEEALWSTKNLRRTHKIILDMKLRDDMTLKQIGKALGVTPERIKQIYKQAINRIRRSISQRKRSSRHHDIRTWNANFPKESKKASQRGRRNGIKARKMYYGIARRMTGWPDLPPLYGRILNLLIESGETSPQKMSECLERRLNHCKNVVMKLHRMGLIEKRKDPADTRKILVKATQKAIDMKPKETE